MQTTELLLANLYLSDASPSSPERVASTRVRHPDYIYSGDVLRWGSIDRSIPILPGLPQISDAKLRVKDQNRKWRDLIVANQYRRKIVDITRVPAGGSESGDSKRVFSGQIIDPQFDPAQVEFTLKDRLWTFLDEIFPPMIVSEIHAQTSPTDEGGILNIILGQCRSIAPDPRGVVPCPHVGTIGSPVTADRYGLACHPVWDVVAVYRNGADGWEVVNPDEFDIVEVSVNAFGGDMTHVFIDFLEDQKGAEIRADVDGAYWDDEGGPASTGPRRNPIDCFKAVMFFFLRKAGLDVDPNTGLTADFDLDSFQAVRDKFETYGYHCDGMIHESLTVREWIGRFLASFNLDLYEGIDGLIKLNFTDADSPAAAAGSIKEGAHILRESFIERAPDVIANQITFRYAENGATDNFEITRTGYVGPAASPATIGEVEKDQVDFYYIREAALALDMVTRRMQWLAPTSYRQEFQVPLLAIDDAIDLASTVLLTHRMGLADGGYVDQEVKVVDMSLDADALTLHIKSVIAVQQELTVVDSSPPTAGGGGTGGGGGNPTKGGECCGSFIYSTDVGSEPAAMTTGDADLYRNSVGTMVRKDDTIPDTDASDDDGGKESHETFGSRYWFLHRPKPNDFTWINNNDSPPTGGSVDHTHGGLHLIAEKSATTSLRCLGQALTEVEGQFTLTAAAHYLLFGIDTQMAGLFIGQASGSPASPPSSGPMLTFGYTAKEDGLYLEIRSYDDPQTPGSGSPASSPATGLIFSQRVHYPYEWLKIVQDCDTLTFSVSQNSQHFEPVYSMARQDFLVADEVGIFANDESNTYRAAMTLLSWQLEEDTCILPDAYVQVGGWVMGQDDSYVYIGTHDVHTIGDNWTSGVQASTIYRVNKTDLTDIVSFDFNPAEFEHLVGGIAVDDTYIYATIRYGASLDGDSARLVRILRSDFSTRSHIDLTGFYRAWSVLLDGGTLWINATDNDVTGEASIIKVDIASFAVVDSHTPGTIPTTGSKFICEGPLIVQDSDYIYIPCQGCFLSFSRGAILRLSKVGFVELWLLDTAISGGGALAIGNSLYQHNSGSASLVNISRSTFTVDGTMSLPSGEFGNFISLDQLADSDVYIGVHDGSSPIHGHLVGMASDNLALDFDESLALPSPTGYEFPKFLIHDPNYFFLLADIKIGLLNRVALIRLQKPRP